MTPGPSRSLESPTEADDLTLLDDLIRAARKAGADAADAMLVRGVALSQAVRLGEIEMLEREEGRDLGLRVLIGPRQAVAATTDIGRDALENIVGRAIAMARAVPEDPYCGLADPALLATDPPAIDGVDSEEPAAQTLIDRARACEAAALAVAGVTNSEGAEASWSLTRVALKASNGFAHAYARSRHDIGTSVIAGEGAGMETDYEFTSAVHAADLDDAAAVGRTAGERAVARLNPRRPKTASVPVVFHPRVASSLLGHLARAINGAAVARGTSFLKDKMGEPVFAEGITIIDDPHRRRGLRSKPFDGEGVANRRRAIVDKGRLTTWFLDLATARQLGLKPTGHASRGPGGPPSPAATNLYLAAGVETPEALMADISSGFYVTSLMGMGVNPVTGDYSRGAAGFWIENGRPAYPVSEVTIAGNLKAMFLAMRQADDLKFRYGTDAPTVRVDGMTVAGATGATGATGAAGAAG